MGDLNRRLILKQREVDQMVQKQQLPIDTDILRMKISKELESRHRVEIEQKLHDIERLQD